MNNKKEKKILKKGLKIRNKNDTYILIRQCGQGGNGIVYKALSNNKPYAIKFISADKEDTRSINITRFENEITFGKKSDHRNIIRILGKGNYKKYNYSIMPYYKNTWEKLLNEKININRLLQYIVQLADAILYIHEQGIIHRDLKPENILINSKGEVILTDFGIASFENYNITKKGDLLANRNYAAPEQKIKKNAKNVTKKADIFSFGLLINQCFTGEVISGSDYIEISTKYPFLYRLSNLVHKMISQNESNRPDIQEVIFELDIIVFYLEKRFTEIKAVLEEKSNNNIKTCTTKTIEYAAESIFAWDTILKNDSFEIREGRDPFLYKSKGIRFTSNETLFNLILNSIFYNYCKEKYDNYLNFTSQYNIPAKKLDIHSEHGSKIYKKLLSYERKYSWNIREDVKQLFINCGEDKCKDLLTLLDRSLSFKVPISILKDGTLSQITTIIKDNINKDFFDINSINLEDYIYINWDSTRFKNIVGHSILHMSYIEETENIKEILDYLKNKWNIIVTIKQNEDLDQLDYILKFNFKKDYKAFKETLLNSKYIKNNYLIEGYLLDLLEIKATYGEKLELNPTSSFEILSVIDKALGILNN